MLDVMGTIKVAWSYFVSGTPVSLMVMAIVSLITN